jgi:hypothetical protein
VVDVDVTDTNVDDYLTTRQSCQMLEGEEVRRERGVRLGRLGPKKGEQCLVAIVRS